MKSQPTKLEVAIAAVVLFVVVVGLIYIIRWLFPISLLYQPFGLFLAYPYAALIPALAFLGAGCYLASTHRHHRFLKASTPFLAGTSWLCYAAWEVYVQREYPPESVPIRVDLMYIAPILWVVSFGSVLAVAVVLVIDCRTKSLERTTGSDERLF